MDKQIKELIVKYKTKATNINKSNPYDECKGRILDILGDVIDDLETIVQGRYNYQIGQKVYINWKRDSDDYQYTLSGNQGFLVDCLPANIEIDECLILHYYQFDEIKTSYHRRLLKTSYERLIIKKIDPPSGLRDTFEDTFFIIPNKEFKDNVVFSLGGKFDFGFRGK